MLRLVLMHTRSPMLRLRCASNMPTWTLNMPQWGLPLADGVVGEVGEVLCGVGDAVKRDEPVVVVETDKVSVDIRADRDGVVAAVLAVEGDEVSEDQPLLRFALESETAEQQRPRDWADAHRRRRLAQAEEAQLRFEQWQVYGIAIVSARARQAAGVSALTPAGLQPICD